MEDTARILVIYTGGTIGMRPSPRGYAPAPGHLQALLSTLPSFHDPAMPTHTTPVSRYGRRVHYQVVEHDPIVDSSNLTMKDWQGLANEIALAYDDWDAFVVLHGTDTMAYTAAALSFMLDGLDKPVVLTGSQIPLSHHRNDAMDNLLGALTIAGHFDIPEVCIYFHDKLLRGNRSRKVDATGLDAFRSENWPPLAKAGVEFKVRWDSVRLASRSGLKVRTGVCPDVVSIRLFPGIGAGVLESCLAPPVRGAVLETFGTGNVPDNRPELLDVLRRARERGVVLVNCTQCHRGSVDTSYATSATLAEVGVVPGADMLPETALVKLAFLLGSGVAQDEVEAALAEDLRGELTPRTPSRRFSFRDDRFARVVHELLASGGPVAGDAARAALQPVLLCAAAAVGDLAALRALLDAGASPDDGDYDGRTALHLAAAEGRADAIELLLARGATVDPKDRHGNRPLDEARRHGHSAIVERLSVAAPPKEW